MILHVIIIKGNSFMKFTIFYRKIPETITSYPKDSFWSHEYWVSQWNIYMLKDFINPNKLFTTRSIDPLHHCSSINQQFWANLSVYKTKYLKFKRYHHFLPFKIGRPSNISPQKNTEEYSPYMKTYLNLYIYTKKMVHATFKEVEHFSNLSRYFYY